jgi:putative peptide zinc metalloprotease protein
MGRRELRAPEATPGEKWWFVIYGPLSFLYRVFLMLIIALHVAQMIPALGLLLAGWALVGYVWPALHGAWRAFAQPGPKRPRAVVGVVGLTALGVGVALLPIPRNILVHGFVAVPEDSVLRPRVAATFAELLVPADAVVVAGQPIARLTDTAVETKVVRLEARQAELRARVIQETATDRVRAMGARELLAQAERELADARRDQAYLTLVSPAAGRLIFTIDTADLTGRFLQRGEQIAMIYRANDAVVRTLAPMADIDALRSKMRAVALRPSYAPAEILGAQIVRISPATTDRLPSSTLSLEGGGPFAVTRESASSWRMEEPAYEVEVRPDAPLPITFLNGRVHVRFSLGWEPAGLGVWRQARLLFMRQLHV